MPKKTNSKIAVKKTAVSKSKKIIEEVSDIDSSENESVEEVVAKKPVAKKAIAAKKATANKLKNVIEELSEEESSEQEEDVKPKITKKMSAKKTLSKKKKELVEERHEDDEYERNTTIMKYDDNKILYIETPHTSAFKQAIEKISGVLSECSIVFIKPTPSVNDHNDHYEEIDDTKEDGDDDEPYDNRNSNESDSNSSKKQSGIRILTLTPDKNIMINLKLDAANFDEFKCEEPTITIGVDTHSLYAALKTINDAHPLVLYINKDNRNVLRINSLHETEQNYEETDIEINLMDLEAPKYTIPKTKFNSKFSMPSVKFNNVCKHISSNSTFVEITSVGNEFIFRGKNDSNKITKAYKDISNGDTGNKNKQLAQGIFELKNLMSFSKCNKLCETVDIYLKNNFPLVLCIPVATLGKLFVFLTPIENDTF